jgi:hypothetical protein
MDSLLPERVLGRSPTKITRLGLRTHITLACDEKEGERGTYAAKGPMVFLTCNTNSFKRLASSASS